MSRRERVGYFLDGFFGKKPVPFGFAYRYYSSGGFWSITMVVAAIAGVPWVVGALYLAGVVR